MSTTTTLQNNVRLRVFLILVISIGIRALRTLAMDSVHKATNLLEINYILYGTILICSLLPFKAAWGMAGVAALTATIFGGSVVALGSIATYRCVSALHSGCIQSSPWSVLTLGLAGILVVLDLYQSWNIYQILRAPTIVQSSLQRIRILFAWVLPFGWLVNAVLLYKSEWSITVGLHIVADPTLIVMATSKETALLMIITAALIASDTMAFFIVKDSLASSAILAQVALTVSAGLMLFMPKSVIKPEDDSKSRTALQPSTLQPSESRSQKDKLIYRKKISGGSRAPPKSLDKIHF